METLETIRCARCDHPNTVRRTTERQRKQCDRCHYWFRIDPTQPTLNPPPPNLLTIGPRLLIHASTISAIVKP